MKLLIENGAEVDLPDEDGDGQLLCLQANKDTGEIVKLLIEKGAEVNLTDKAGRTALMFASRKRTRGGRETAY